MALSIKKLHPTFGGEVAALDLRDSVEEGDLAEIRSALDTYAVLVFRDQKFANEEHIDFAQRLDGALHAKSASNAIQKNRFGNDAISDISNVDGDGQILDADDRRRLQALANRLWHTDASFQDPPGRYSMLSALVLPPDAPDTQFADMRAAYDALPNEQKSELDGLSVHHSIAYSREVLGFEFSEAERRTLQGAHHPLIRGNTATGRKSLYLASHASMIVGWPIPEGRMLLRDLMEHATQPQFVLSHSWRVGDLVIWDNRTTMHRATAFDDKHHKRELRRVTTLDIDAGIAAGTA